MKTLAAAVSQAGERTAKLASPGSRRACHESHMLNIASSPAHCVQRDLQAHPSSRVDGIDFIAVDIAVLPSGALELTYRLSGDLSHIEIPTPTPAPPSAARTDGLWRHTCVEAFIRSAGSPAYREFNFSPSGLWQAYAFNSYRAGGLLEPATAPHIECRINPGVLTLHATIPPENIPSGKPLQLGLTTVVERIDGSIGYWALQHAAGKPDFHHPDTFDLELALP